MKRRGFLQTVLGGIGALSLKPVEAVTLKPAAPPSLPPPLPVVPVTDPWREMGRSFAMNQTCCVFYFEPPGKS